MADRIENLKSLYTALIDSRNGYDEAFADAEGKGLSALFRELMAMHAHAAEGIGAYLNSLDQPVDGAGSFMTTVNRAVISIRALFGGLNESVIPGLIDGETRVLAIYDRALETSPPGTPEHSLLGEQRQALQAKIADMAAMKTKAA